MNRQYVIILLILIFNLSLSGCAEMYSLSELSLLSKPEYKYKETENKVYKDFTDHGKYLSGLYNKDLDGKNIKVSLVVRGSSSSFSQAYSMQYPGIGDRIVIQAYPPKYIAEINKLTGRKKMMKEMELNNKSYVIAVPRKYRDSVFNFKDGTPITVWGMVKAYDAGHATASNIILFADKLEVKKQVTHKLKRE